MAKRTCSIDDCQRLVHGHGWCFMHYQRWRKHGNPEALLPRFTDCQVPGCEKPPRSALGGICEMHYVRRWRHGNTDLIDTRRPDATYRAAHARIASDRGPARDQGCVDCGIPAHHWSYTHADPNERYSPGGQPYSLNSAHYEPRCAPCHARFDGRCSA